MENTKQYPFDLLNIKPKEAFKVFYRSMVIENVQNPDFIINATKGVIKAYAENDLKISENVPLYSLYKRWYNSLKSSTPAYEVYDSPLYLAEAFACWSIYARKYLLQINKEKSLSPTGVVKDLGQVKSVVDLGCGIGFSTAALTQLFPNAQVVGTNVPDSDQTRIAKRIADPYKTGENRFEMVASPNQINKPVDLVFASEYFEHFETPIQHLFEVLQELDPCNLLIANTFTSPSIGHFDIYKHEAVEYSGIQISRLFNKALKEKGYENIKTTLWNNRPTYWKKS
tara:strand:- start:2728 stop:3579 length:852 start_codon:yes stop_codon:yes gene_type:complete